MVRSTFGALLGLAVLTTPAAGQNVARRFRSFLPAGDTIVGVAFVQPATGRSAYLSADVRIHAASTMKLPVLIELARRVDAGDFRWEDSLLVENRFTSIADGSDFSVDAGDDSDSLPYTFIGRGMRIDELARRMIVRSSNLATDVLIQRLDPARVNATAHLLGADSVSVLRGVEDGAAFRAGLNNTVTARGLAQLLTALLGGRAASREGTQHVLALLAAQEFNGGIPAGVRPGTLVAHKTGWITGAAHDAALVYPPDAPPYILVVLTKGYPTEAAAEAVMQRIAAEAERIATGH